MTITIFWLMNQIAVLIVFLNFVIAVISDVYETVMDQKVRFIYGHRQQFNEEYDRISGYFTSVSDGEVTKAISNVVIVSNVQEYKHDNEF